jgi:DNA polymerase (family 10)
MDKKDVARLLEQIAAFLELKGENAFRIRAYQNAARAVAGFPGDLRAAVESGELAEVKGIGPATLEIIRESLQTGRSRILEEFRAQIPSGLVEMMKISGLGVAKIRQIHESLGIASLSDLEAAARDGRLAKLPRFGPKTALKILKGLEFLREASEFKLFHHAREEARSLARVLADVPEVVRVEVVGSVRRHRELIRDLDFVVQLDGSVEAFADRLGAVVGASEFVRRDHGAVTLKFASGTVVDVYTSDANTIGLETVRATGSREHVQALAARAHALGLEWTGTGIERDGMPLPCLDEEEFYRTLGLAYIPPELREGRGEIEAAAQGALPRLIESRDVRGFLHCHSDYSDGSSTVRDWAVAAQDAGYEYVGITDHSAAAMYAGGLRPEDVPAQHAEIDRVNREFPDITVLKGVEVDILRDGRLDYDPEVLASFDFVIAAIHSRFGQSAEEMTARVHRAMDDCNMAILGHPTGRLLLSRDPYPMDLEAVLTKATERKIALEINADPHRLDLDWRIVRDAVGMGALISIGADAHSVGGVGNIDLGVGIARKGWLTAEQVLNTRPLEGFLDFVAERRRGSST